MCYNIYIARETTFSQWITEIYNFRHYVIIDDYREAVTLNIY